MMRRLIAAGLVTAAALLLTAAPATADDEILCVHSPGRPVDIGLCIRVP